MCAAIAADALARNAAFRTARQLPLAAEAGHFASAGCLLLVTDDSGLIDHVFQLLPLDMYSVMFAMFDGALEARVRTVLATIPSASRLASGDVEARVRHALGFGPWTWARLGKSVSAFAGLLLRVCIFQCILARI